MKNICLGDESNKIASERKPLNKCVDYKNLLSKFNLI